MSKFLFPPFSTSFIHPSCNGRMKVPLLVGLGKNAQVVEKRPHRRDGWVSRHGSHAGAYPFLLAARPIAAIRSQMASGRKPPGEEGRVRWKLEVGSVGQIDNSSRQGVEATWTLTQLLAGATLTGFIVDSAGFLLLKIRPKNMSPPHTEKRRFFMAFGFWLLKGGNLTNQPISGSGGAHLLRDSTFLGPCTLIGGGGWVCCS